MARKHMGARAFPKIDTGPAPGLDRQYTAQVSPGMSRLIKYIGMELRDDEMANRRNDDTTFKVPKERDRLVELYHMASQLDADGKLQPFHALFALTEHFAQQLRYA